MLNRIFLPFVYFLIVFLHQSISFGKTASVTLIPLNEHNEKIARGGGGHAGGGRVEGAGARTPAERTADRAARNAAEEAAALEGAAVPTTVVETPTTTTDSSTTPSYPVTTPAPAVQNTMPTPTGQNAPVNAPNPVQSASEHEIVQSLQVDLDRSISQNIQMRISMDKSVHGGDVEIATQNSVVSLSGNVQTEAQKQKIEDYARGAAGVKGVISNITVGGE